MSVPCHWNILFWPLQSIGFGRLQNSHLVIYDRDRWHYIWNRKYRAAHSQLTSPAWVVLGGGTHIKDPHANFRNAFAGSSRSGGDVCRHTPSAHELFTHVIQYATAAFKVLNAYGGWSNANYVLNEVRDPVRTIKIAGPLGLGICTFLYMTANIAYFSSVSLLHMIHYTTWLTRRKSCFQSCDNRWNTEYWRYCRGLIL